MPSLQLFHQILGLMLLLLPCYAHGKPTQIFPVPGFKAERGISQAYLPGFPSVAGSEMDDAVLQLKDRISKLEGVLYLQGKITKSGGKIFATSGKTADFHATVKMCQEAGGCIASPRNADENAAILHFVKQFNRYAYLGIKESLIPGTFQFLNGGELSYTNWYSHEPSGKGEEECVEMYTDGTWNDRRCNQNRLVVCQF
ncbi:surfactant protein A1 isoform X1 [Gallus gallus]|uniref:Lung lectin n=1 Tax=Gallus gallus TaxID=9031 RepID=Q2LK96_CHICK|nr:surfactant protein A1 precursor [Gallus gallus]XP_046775987.1 surfactant protein A1 isoform X1 [Gallus gallus]XP_046798756.1 surfactant protein A1 isoform X1 [Gallus gallus]AAZ29616.1 lung lectin precursor [Gallus gallus]|eukprot:NP_001034255.1 surfactant protein A1 precursor [Gallus gallus]